jgi:uncharacterized membrane protein
MTSDILFATLRMLHFFGLAAVFAGVLLNWLDSARKGNKPLLVGAVTQLATGIALVGMLGENADQAKVTVKFGLAVLVAVLAWVFLKKPMSRPVSIGIIVVPVLAVLVASYWRFLPF